MRQVAVAAVVFGVAFATPPAAADCQSGLAAYRHGDCAATIRGWPPLAEQGIASQRGGDEGRREIQPGPRTQAFIGAVEVLVHVPLGGRTMASDGDGNRVGGR